MTTDLKIFMCFVAVVIIAVAVSGFLVFSNFLNRERERAKRFRARHAPKAGDTNSPQERKSL